MLDKEQSVRSGTLARMREMIRRDIQESKKVWESIFPGSRVTSDLPFPWHDTTHHDWSFPGKDDSRDIARLYGDFFGDAKKNDNFPYITPPLVRTASRNTRRDREESWEDIFNSGQAGIDTVHLFIPLDSSLTDPESSLWDQDRTSYDKYGNLKRLVGKLRKQHGDVDITARPDEEKLYLRFNAPRLLLPKSEQLLPPDALIPLVDAILNDLSGAVSPNFDLINYEHGELRRVDSWEKQVKITRLDVARNFLIDEPTMMRKALNASRPNYWKTLIEFRNSDGGWTLEHRTGRVGRDRFYDKKAELKKRDKQAAEDCPDGLYRFECQLEENRLEDFFAKSLHEVTIDRCVHVLEERWRQLRWGVKWGKPDTLDQALRGLPWKKQDELYGFLRRSLNGTTDVYRDKKQRDLRKEALAQGLNPGLLMDEQGAPTRMLDLKKGRIVDISPA